MSKIIGTSKNICLLYLLYGLVKFQNSLLKTSHSHTLSQEKLKWRPCSPESSKFCNVRFLLLQNCKKIKFFNVNRDTTVSFRSRMILGKLTCKQ